MYKCKYFDIKELVDHETFRRFGTDAWMFFDPRALMSLDAIREFYGVPVSVNNWPYGGSNQYRGFRPGNCDVGAEYSQHRLGAAFDCNIQGIPASVVRKDIVDNKDTIFQLINCIEDDVSWVHFDVRNINDRIRIVRP